METSTKFFSDSPNLRLRPRAEEVETTMRGAVVVEVAKAKAEEEEEEEEEEDLMLSSLALG